MNATHSYRRGEVYLADLGVGFGSEQGGTRPVLLLQNNMGNLFCPTLIVTPLTSRTGKKAAQPTHYQTNGDGKGIRPSTVLLEQIKTIDKRRIKKYMGRLSRREMDGIDKYILTSLGISIPEEMEAP